MFPLLREIYPRSWAAKWKIDKAVQSSIRSIRVFIEKYAPLISWLLSGDESPELLAAIPKISRIRSYRTRFRVSSMLLIFHQFAAMLQRPRICYRIRPQNHDLRVYGT